MGYGRRRAQRVGCPKSPGKLRGWSLVTKESKLAICLGSLTLEAARWPPGAGPQPQGFRAWRWKGLPAPHLGAVSARDTVTARAFPRQPGLLPSRPRAQMVLHLLRSLAIWRGEERPHPAPVTEKTHTQAPALRRGLVSSSTPHCSCSEESTLVHRFFLPFCPLPTPLPLLDL